ncbi:MAG: endonuclease NucS domain-containing protein [Terriglobia bacterium]
MLQKIHEANLEALIAEDLNRVEEGLTLIGRQYTAPPVGRIDLLCQDGNGDLVVIEIKRFGASTESIIDQVTRYMGWVEEHLARSGQRVRGIIVVGKPEVALAYSAKAVRNLSIMSVDVSLTTYSMGTQSVARSRRQEGKTD